MPFRRVAILTALACLAIAAPAAASERSEARAYAAALQVDVAPTRAEVDAIFADWRFRSEYVAATCLDAVKQGVRDHDRDFELSVLYGLYGLQAIFAEMAAWSQAVDERLAAIPTRSRALRRGRAARRSRTEESTLFAAAAPEDFCAEARAWQGKGWKARSSPLKPLMRALRGVTRDDDRDRRRVRRAAAVLKRHGASWTLRWAFAGHRAPPEGGPVIELPDDPVDEALAAPDRASPDGGPVRRP